MTTFQTSYLTAASQKKLQTIGATITHADDTFQVEIPGASRVASILIIGEDEWIKDNQYVLGYFDSNAGLDPVFCLPEENPIDPRNETLFKEYFWERANWNQWQLWRKDHCLPLP